MYRLLFLLLFPFSLLSQDYSLDTVQVIHVISDYRAKVLLENADATKKFEKIKAKFLNAGFNSRQLYNLYSDLISMTSRSFTEAKILWRIKKKYNNDDITLITSDILKVYQNTIELFDLIHDGQLQGNYPFVINKETTLFTELPFYKINPGDKIGEIGAGGGNFSLVLALIYSDIDVVANDISKGAFDNMKAKFERNFSQDSIQRINAVLGGKSDCNLKENEFDKIIIRNAFHHFSKSKKMLRSIMSALKEDGVLCLNEPFKEEKLDQYKCPQTMSLEKMKKVILKNGFLLKDELIMNERMLLKFKKKKK